MTGDEEGRKSVEERTRASCLRQSIYLMNEVRIRTTADLKVGETQR